MAKQTRANYVVVPDYTYVCPGEGRYEYPKVANCTSYALCLKSRNKLIAFVYQCPENTFYNPSDQKCSFWYICPSSITTPAITTTSTTTTQLTTIEPTLSPFMCTQAGRFQNISDKNCNSYFLCSPTCDNGFKLIDYTCPGNSVFDPEVGLCSLINTCSNGVVI